MLKELPEEYNFKVEKLQKLANEKELSEVLSQVIGLLGELDDISDKKGWAQASDSINESATILVRCIRKTMENRLKEVA